MTFKDCAFEILKNSDKPLSVSEIWERIKLNNFDISTKGKTPIASLSSILLAYSNNSNNVTFHYKKQLFTIISENPNKYDLIDKSIKSINNSEEITDIDNDEIPDEIEYESFYECVLDDNETILKIFNNDSVLNYKTEKGNSFTYFFPDSKTLIKIGRTNNVEHRYRTLKTGNPDLNIEFILPSETFEKNLHNKFEKFHHKLEWYFYSNEIKNFITYEKKKRQLAINCWNKYNESIKIENNFLELF